MTLLSSSNLFDSASGLRSENSRNSPSRSTTLPIDESHTFSKMLKGFEPPMQPAPQAPLTPAPQMGPNKTAEPPKPPAQESQPSADEGMSDTQRAETRQMQRRANAQTPASAQTPAQAPRPHLAPSNTVKPPGTYTVPPKQSDQPTEPADETGDEAADSQHYDAFGGIRHPPIIEPADPVTPQASAEPLPPFASAPAPDPVVCGAVDPMQAMAMATTQPDEAGIRPPDTSLPPGETSLSGTPKQEESAPTVAGPLTGSSPGRSPAAAPAASRNAEATALLKAQAGNVQADASQSAAALQKVGEFGAELQKASTGLAPSQAAVRGDGLAALNGFAQAQAAARTATGTPATARADVVLSQPLHSAGFAPEMAARVSVLAADGVQQAQLHLNPAEMGPVAVSIVIDGQQAQISFHAEQAETRSVLEQGLPDLAAALRDTGLTLSGGGVFQQSSEQSQAQQQAREAGFGSDSRTTRSLSGSDDDFGAATRSAPPPRATRGLVDLYA